MNKKTSVPEPFFKCRECGFTEIEVTREYAKYNGVMESKRCTCGSAPSGLAAFRKDYDREIFQDCGIIESDHRITFTSKSRRVFIYFDLSVPLTIMCRACFDKKGNRWHEKKITEMGEDAYYVSCQNCERSIEFGWSLPNGQGLIYPVECRDFDPFQCWPDPLYVYDWMKRGWLREDFLKAKAS